MKNEFTYDPEDLESLMMHKSFNELYPEEKSFVLKHMDSPEEYESMRSTLFAIRASKGDNEELTMSANRKEDVMAAFRAEHRRERWFSLNGLFMWFFPPNRSWIQKPAFQLAVLTAVVFGGVILFNNSNSFETTQLAELETKQNSENTQDVAEENLPRVIEDKSSAFEEQNEAANSDLEKIAAPDHAEELESSFESLDVPDESQLKKEAPSFDAMDEFNGDDGADFQSGNLASKEFEPTKDVDESSSFRDQSMRETSANEPRLTVPNDELAFTGPEVTMDTQFSDESFTLSPSTTASPNVALAESKVEVSAERSVSITGKSSEDLGNVFTLLEAAY